MKRLFRRTLAVLLVIATVASFMGCSAFSLITKNKDNVQEVEKPIENTDEPDNEFSDELSVKPKKRTADQAKLADLITRMDNGCFCDFVEADDEINELHSDKLLPGQVFYEITCCKSISQVKKHAKKYLGDGVDFDFSSLIKHDNKMYFAKTPTDSGSYSDTDNIRIIQWLDDYTVLVSFDCYRNDGLWETDIRGTEVLEIDTSGEYYRMLPSSYITDPDNENYTKNVTNLNVLVDKYADYHYVGCCCEMEPADDLEKLAKKSAEFRNFLNDNTSFKYEDYDIYSPMIFKIRCCDSAEEAKEHISMLMQHTKWYLATDFFHYEGEFYCVFKKMSGDGTYSLHSVSETQDGVIFMIVYYYDISELTETCTFTVQKINGTYKIVDESRVSASKQ